MSATIANRPKKRGAPTRERNTPAAGVEHDPTFSEQGREALILMLVENENECFISKRGYSDEVFNLRQICFVADCIRETIENPAFFPEAMGYRQQLACDLAEAMGLRVPEELKIEM